MMRQLLALFIIMLFSDSNFALAGEVNQQFNTQPGNYYAVSENNTDSLYQEACILSKGGYNYLARKVLQDILTKDPQNFDALILMGVISTKEDNLTIALDYFKKAETLYPDNVTTHLKLAELYLLLGDRINSNLQYSKAEKLDYNK